MHQSSYNKMKTFATKYLNENEELSILDIGSQDVNGTYKAIFEKNNWKYIGCDMCGGKNVDVILSEIYNWKEIEPNSMDVVISGQTFEHVEYIWNTIIEICNAMKEGGLCCIIAPFAFPEHKYPLDCWRIYSDGFSALAKFAGLEVVEVYTDYSDGPSGALETALICKKPYLCEDEKIKLQQKIEIVRSLARDYEIDTLKKV